MRLKSCFHPVASKSTRYWKESILLHEEQLLQCVFAVCSHVVDVCRPNIQQNLPEINVLRKMTLFWTFLWSLFRLNFRSNAHLSMSIPLNPWIVHDRYPCIAAIPRYIEAWLCIRTCPPVPVGVHYTHSYPILADLLFYLLTSKFRHAVLAELMILVYPNLASSG